MAQFSVYSRYTKFCISTLKSRILKNKGTLFLVEKTSQDLSNKQTKNVDFYEKKFDFVNLKKVADYKDINDCNSVFVGVKS
jgi:hypothetical protein